MSPLHGGKNSKGTLPSSIPWEINKMYTPTTYYLDIVHYLEGSPADRLGVLQSHLSVWRRLLPAGWLQNRGAMEGPVSDLSTPTRRGPEAGTGSCPRGDDEARHPPLSVLPEAQGDRSGSI
ncbi:hypothetical protein EVAR_80333_1 [Eumeta japonica]|uniref:Uncharacterized protein n=1 Tax=Eumeta variegata TaxID=151549 RepID=A0A4C1X0U7_EUMVA|nr:hypothetical protein EVAR_80333_1 [Eumeta japonica]